MHLSRGHTNSNVISALPFTDFADLKSVTHLSRPFSINDSFSGVISRLMKDKMSFWLAAAWGSFFEWIC